MTRRSSAADGFTLSEILISIVLLGVLGVGLFQLGEMITSASGKADQNAKVENYATSVGAAVRNIGWLAPEWAGSSNDPCPPGGSDPIAQFQARLNQQTAAGGPLAPPSDLSAPTVTNVQWGNSNSTGQWNPPPSCNNASVAARITYTVKNTRGGETLEKQIVVMRP